MIIFAKITIVGINQLSSMQGLSIPNEIAKWILTKTTPTPVVLNQKPSPFKSPGMIPFSLGVEPLYYQLFFLSPKELSYL